MNSDDPTLPPGWAVAQIGDVCTLKNGRAFKSTEWREAGLPIVRIQNLNRADGKFNYFDGAPEPDYHLKGGELLFAWSGTPGTSFGAHIWNGGEAVLNQHIFKVGFDPNVVEIRFLRYAINQKLEQLISVAHGGVGLRHLTKSAFETTRIEIPPINEQRRIADKLDLCLQRIGVSRARTERVVGLVESFKNDVLVKAASGLLTLDWRRKNKKDFNWEEITIEELALEVFDGPFGSNLKTDDYTSSGIRVARLENLARMKFLSHKEAFISRAKHKALSRHTLFKNDVLFSSFMMEGTRVALLPEGWSGKAINKSDCFCVRPNVEKCVPEFLLFLLSSGTVYELLRGEIHGSTRPRINLTQLRRLTINLPPVAEQKEAVESVKSLFALADKIKEDISVVQVTLTDIIATAFSEAFKGRFVDQDASDESAVQMLEKSRARKKVAAALPQIKKKKQTTRMKHLSQEELRKIIVSMPSDQFTFAELQAMMQFDYETVKDSVFKLLNESEPMIEQKFNTLAKRMELRRTKK